ncbi:MAG: cell division protein FtsZ [Terriglobales bacterium]
MSLESPIRLMLDDDDHSAARIKVLGVGGGGGNAVNRMIDVHLEGVDFIVANTDMQALKLSLAPVKIQLGGKLTSGRGAGSDPQVGRQAALEDTEKILEVLAGADMVFVTAGLGGGTGTGAAPVIASLANELGALTVAVVTKPFQFEGKRRMAQAEQGLRELAEAVDTVITIPNDRLLQVAQNAAFVESFRIADDILRQAVQGISDIITIPGIINRDFADIRTIMHGMGYAIMGTAIASGPHRAVEAARAAISSPLLENTSIDGARGILINISGSSNLMLSEVNEASSVIQAAAHEDANIIFGATLNEDMQDEIKITVIATGFRAEYIQNRALAAAATPAPNPAPVAAAAAPSATRSAKESPVPSPSPSPTAAASADEDDLDVPAFLRLGNAQTAS